MLLLLLGLLSGTLLFLLLCLLLRALLLLLLGLLSGTQLFLLLCLLLRALLLLLLGLLLRALLLLLLGLLFGALLFQLLLLFPGGWRSTLSTRSQIIWALGVAVAVRTVQRQDDGARRWGRSGSRPWTGQNQA